MTKARDLANASTALSAVSATELGYLDGVTSAVQTQIDAKLASSTAATTYVANSLADAKGDILVASADNTVTRLPVGSTGDTIVADSSTATGLRYQEPKAVNPILNSSFQIWQRGTSVATSGTSVKNYTADQWNLYRGALVGGATVSRQVTGDTTNLPNIQYCARVARDSGNTSTERIGFENTLETLNSIPFVGKTVTFSFYARKGANFSAASSILPFYVVQGTGTDQNCANTGFTSQSNAVSGNATLTTTWQRFTATGTILATSTEIGFSFLHTPSGTAGAADYYEVTGVQLEIGSVATPYKSNGGTIQGELDACERYLPTITGAGNYYVGGQRSSTNAIFPIAFRVQPRVAPTGITISALSDFFMFNSSLGGYTPTSIAYNTAGLNTGALDVGVSGGTGAATGDAVFFRANTNSKILFTGCEL